MAPRSTTETFFFFGDSLTLGVNDNAMPGGWVSRLVLLGSQAGWYDMPPATFYNLGVRRHTSTDIAARWQAEVASRQIPGTINHLAFRAWWTWLLPRCGRWTRSAPRSCRCWIRPRPWVRSCLSARLLLKSPP